ncbi:MAG: tail protein X [Oscillospiraceae bacterium]|nr:tail protein X [Oscillospiraceae bacterium]
MTYITRQGDMWDLIAHTQLGDAAHIDKIMNLNRQYRAYYIFPAGIELELPAVSPGVVDEMPPWRLVAG